MFKYILVLSTLISLSYTFSINDTVSDCNNTNCNSVCKDLEYNGGNCSKTECQCYLLNNRLNCDYSHGCKKEKCEKCCKREGYKKGYCSTATTCFCYSKPATI